MNILGVCVNTINMTQALIFIQQAISRKDREYICVSPAHTIMDAQSDFNLRLILNQSGLTTPDGMSIVWLLKLHGYRNVERVYGPDLMLEVCRFGITRNWRHFVYGGDVDVADALASRLADKITGLSLAGTFTPPFRPLSEDEDQKIIDTINNSGADIVWIGLSSPKQEYWMAEHLGKINAPVMIGVGAAFDFLAGTKPQAPRWVQRGGLEWLFRLASEPRRLWPRYRKYPRFALLALLQLLNLKDFPIER